MFPAGPKSGRSPACNLAACRVSTWVHDGPHGYIAVFATHVFFVASMVTPAQPGRGTTAASVQNSAGHATCTAQNYTPKALHAGIRYDSCRVSIQQKPHVLKVQPICHLLAVVVIHVCSEHAGLYIHKLNLSEPFGSTTRGLSWQI